MAECLLTATDAGYALDVMVCFGGALAVRHGLEGHKDAILCTERQPPAESLIVWHALVALRGPCLLCRYGVLLQNGTRTIIRLSRNRGENTGLSTQA